MIKPSSILHISLDFTVKSTTTQHRIFKGWNLAMCVKNKIKPCEQKI